MRKATPLLCQAHSICYVNIYLNLFNPLKVALNYYGQLNQPLLSHSTPGLPLAFFYSKKEGE